jgi:hypothetical protein
MNPDKYQAFVRQMTVLISNTLVSFRNNMEEQVIKLALDFHPWNGFIGIALLTNREVQIDPLLDNVNEMAAWKYYNFGEKIDEWAGMNAVAEQMKLVYEYDMDSDDLFKCCAEAMASSSVQQAVSHYHIAERFTISVAHPDDLREYYVQ